MHVRALTMAIAVSMGIPSLEAQTPPPRPEILVLGVYHMANPGHDIFNTQADDVLTPKRQREIEQVVEVLQRFRPTKIAIEGDPWNKRYTREYADYLAGKYPLTRNEIDQIGYRLAKASGHQTIYPVDADGDFPWPRVVNYAKGSGRAKELDAITTDVGNMVNAQNEYLASHTVLDVLLLLNSDQRAAQDVGYYYREAQLGEPGDWAGADLVADWFRRNMRIYSNVMKLVDSPGERIVVIFGSGHLGWLRHDFESNPTVRLRKLAEFTK